MALPFEHNFGRHPESKTERDMREYKEVIREYSRQFREIKKLEGVRVSGGAPIPDSENKNLILFLDKERHQTHLMLVELASRLGKTKADVLIDILREEGGLEEYGLPEFGVRSKEDLCEDRELLRDNEVFLVFDYTMADYGGELEYSTDHSERIKRAELLAKEIGGRFLEITEGQHHETTEMLGAAFPKEDLEKVAGIIRDNPKKFRLGEEFYKE